MNILEFPAKLWSYFQLLGMLSIACWIALAVLMVCYARRHKMLRILAGIATLAMLVLFIAKATESHTLLLYVCWSVIALFAVIYLLSRQWLPSALLVGTAVTLLMTLASSDAVHAIRRKPSEMELKAAQLQSQETLKLTEEEAAAVAESEINRGESTNEDEGAGAADVPAKTSDAGDPEALPEYRRQGKVERVTSSEGPGAADSESSDGPTNKSEEKKADGLDFAIATPTLARELESVDFYRARQWDSINLFFVRSLFMIVAGLFVVDYLRRFNRTFEQILPLPIAGSWVDSAFAKTHSAYLHDRTGSRVARAVKQYLDRAVAKGETFVYFGERDPWKNDSLARLPYGLSWLWRLQKMQVNDNDKVPGSQFVLESLWFRRYCFTVAGEDTARSFLRDLVEFLGYRNLPHARVRQSVNVVWDFQTPPTRDVLDDLIYLIRETNFKLVVASSVALDDEVADYFEEIIQIGENQDSQQVELESASTA